MLCDPLRAVRRLRALGVAFPSVFHLDGDAVGREPTGRFLEPAELSFLGELLAGDGLEVAERPGHDELVLVPEPGGLRLGHGSFSGLWSAQCALCWLVLPLSSAAASLVGSVSLVGEMTSIRQHAGVGSDPPRWDQSLCRQGMCYGPPAVNDPRLVATECCDDITLVVEVGIAHVESQTLAATGRST